MSNTKVKRLVIDSAIRIVKIDSLNVDTSYQRGLKRKHKNIVTDFNQKSFGTPVIGEREDGGLWIVDGLQRITAIKKLGKKKFRAEVFASQGPEHEAVIFKDINMGRTRITPGEEFKALLTGQDKTAWEIKEAVEMCGFRIIASQAGRSDCNRQQQLTCVSTLQRIVKAWGIEPLKFALLTIKEAWPDDPQSTDSSMVWGLAIYHHAKEGIISPKLMPKLKKVTPHSILYAAQQITLSGHKAWSVAKVIDSETNKKRK